MNILEESYSIDTTEPGFVCIHHVQVVQSYYSGLGNINAGGDMWFERANLPWVVDTMRACLTTYGFPKTASRRGQDHLIVFESGPDQQPFINLQNERPKDVRHGGVYAPAFSKPLAEKLVEELARIAPIVGEAD